MNKSKETLENVLKLKQIKGNCGYNRCPAAFFIKRNLNSIVLQFHCAELKSSTKNLANSLLDFAKKNILTSKQLDEVKRFTGIKPLKNNGIKTNSSKKCSNSCRLFYNCVAWKQVNNIANDCYVYKWLNQQPKCEKDIIESIKTHPKFSNERYIAGIRLYELRLKKQNIKTKKGLMEYKRLRRAIIRLQKK